MPNRNGMSRRRFLRNAGVAAAAGTLPISSPRVARAATKLRPVTMQMDWLYQGPNVGFLVSRNKGFYAEVGLDVTTIVGNGSGSATQIMAAKNATFGMADGSVVGLGVSKGMDIRMVAAIYRRNPAGVEVLDKSDIKSPKNLEGKTVGIPTSGTSFKQFPLFLKGCGVDPSKVKIVNTDPAVTPAALIQGRVQAIAGYAQGYVPAIEIRGNKKARILWYSDCGVDAISNGIVVHNDLLKEDPDLIRRFVKASLKGFLHARTHATEAAQIIKKYSPGTDVRISEREMELSWETWVTPNTRNKPMGWMSEKDWNTTVNLLKQWAGLKEAIDPHRLYTNEFVPTEAEFIPPQPPASK